MRHLLLALLVVAPAATGASHLPAIDGLRVEGHNQRLEIAWDAASDPGVTGYTVLLWQDGQVFKRWNVTEPRATTRDVVNERTYAVQVAARDADGATGPWSGPVAATPQHPHDSTYLALGLILVWLGLWTYALLLTRAERDLRTDLERLKARRRRP